MTVRLLAVLKREGERRVSSAARVEKRAKSEEGGGDAQDRVPNQVSARAGTGGLAEEARSGRPPSDRKSHVTCDTYEFCQRVIGETDLLRVDRQKRDKGVVREREERREEREQRTGSREGRINKREQKAGASLPLTPPRHPGTIEAGIRSEPCAISTRTSHSGILESGGKHNCSSKVSANNLAESLDEVGVESVDSAARALTALFSARLQKYLTPPF